MKAYRNNWYYIGGIIFAVLAIILGLFGDMIDPMRRIMIVLFMCLLAHEFEEYAVPGGFPSAWNIGVSGETEVGDRYPLNTKSAFIVNVCCAYPIYIIGIIFCDIHVISIFITYFTMAQIMMHGLMMNKKMGTLYNPGVGTALFLLVPVGIYSLWYIASNFDIPAWNWWVPILFFPLVAFTTILLPILKCQDKESPSLVESIFFMHVSIDLNFIYLHLSFSAYSILYFQSTALQNPGKAKLLPMKYYVLR